MSTTRPAPTAPSGDATTVPPIGEFTITTRPVISGFQVINPVVAYQADIVAVAMTAHDPYWSLIRIGPDGVVIDQKALDIMGYHEALEIEGTLFLRYLAAGRQGPRCLISKIDVGGLRLGQPIEVGDGSCYGVAALDPDDPEVIWVLKDDTTVARIDAPTRSVEQVDISHAVPDDYVLSARSVWSMNDDLYVVAITDTLSAMQRRFPPGEPVRPNVLIRVDDDTGEVVDTKEIFGWTIATDGGIVIAPPRDTTYPALLIDPATLEGSEISRDDVPDVWEGYDLRGAENQWFAFDPGDSPDVLAYLRDPHSGDLVATSTAPRPWEDDTSVQWSVISHDDGAILFAATRDQPYRTWSFVVEPG